ncbi:MAG: glycosyltransferase, partial [Planctomycetota bacterium]|nr:glycosyltransferase [Planctomycetota bacterium]
SVIVHQGGAGTLHTALASGRPMLVVPFAHDQGDNAERAAAHGGARVLFPQRLNARRMGEHLDALRNDVSHARAAAAVAELVRAETGKRAACDWLERVAR